MKALILKLVVLLFLLISCFVVFPKLLRPSHEVVYGKFKLKKICSYDSLDYLFIGSSYVYSGIDVSYFDSIKKRALDLSMATSGPYFTKILCDNYLSNCTVKPKKIVINLCLNNFSELASDAWDKYPMHQLSDNTISEEDVFANWCNLSMYIKLKRKQLFEGRLRRENLSEEDKMTISNELLQLKGFQPSTDVYNNDVYVKTAQFYTPYKTESFSLKKKNYFINYIEALKKQNLNVQLIEMPTFKLKEFYSKDYLFQYESLIKQMNTDLGFKVLRYNTKLNDSLYRNIDHLNQFGAKLYTKFLIEEMDKYNG